MKKKKAELAALGEWTHINCLRGSAKDEIHDEILRKLVHRFSSSADETKPPAPQPPLLSLLSAVDLKNVADLTVRDIPGGVVSFLFEKVKKVSLDDEFGPDFADNE